MNRQRASDGGERVLVFSCPGGDRTDDDKVLHTSKAEERTDEDGVGVLTVENG